MSVILLYDFTVNGDFRYNPCGWSLRITRGCTPSGPEGSSGSSRRECRSVAGPDKADSGYTIGLRCHYGYTDLMLINVTGK